MKVFQIPSPRVSMTMHRISCGGGSYCDPWVLAKGEASRHLPKAHGALCRLRSQGSGGGQGLSVQWLRALGATFLRALAVPPSD